MNEKGKSYKKADALELWAGLPENQDLRPGTIAYRHKGTTIDEDGVRICGTEEFILSVLSHLKPLLKYENGSTRLGVSFSQIQDKETKELIPNAFRCSVQVHERGPEAQMVNAIIEGARERQAARQAVA